MNDTGLQASTNKILRTDYAAFAGVVLPVAYWVMTLFILIAIPDTDDQGHSQILYKYIFAGIALLLTVVGIPLSAWRVNRIKGIFSRGVETSGRITEQSHYRQRGSVKYNYYYMGRQYTDGNWVSRYGPASSLQIGDEVTLVVDKDNPKQAVIRDLYV